MFTKINNPRSFPGADNKGSASTLINYLEKENVGKDTLEKEVFFSSKCDQIGREEAVETLDSNNKNLGKNDSKFFMLTINPSKEELSHLIMEKTGHKNIQSLKELDKNDQKVVFQELRNYTRDVMDSYARNFNRPNVTSGSDLVYFAKVETSREYKHYDVLVCENKRISEKIFELENKLKEASSFEAINLKQHIESLEAKYYKQGDDIIKAGLKKNGLQLHVHVVVSRNDITQTSKLSPLSKSKGGFQKLNGKEVMQGFNHEKFKQAVANRFSEKYSYNPREKEQYHPKHKEEVFVVTKAEKKLKSEAIRSIKQEMLQGNFSHERKMLNVSKKVARVISSPQSALNIAKTKLLGILKGAALEK